MLDKIKKREMTRCYKCNKLVPKHNAFLIVERSPKGEKIYILCFKHNTEYKIIKRYIDLMKKIRIIPALYYGKSCRKCKYYETLNTEIMTIEYCRLKRKAINLEYCKEMFKI